MKAAAVFVLSLALSATSAVAAAPREFDVSKEPALGDVYPDRVTKFADGVTGLADVVYASLPGFRPMVVDVYMPADKAPKPLIMYIHGGAWMGGHTRQSGALTNFPEVLAKLASEGFVVASLEYRLSGEAPFPAQLQDARAAIRFLKANAARYGIDPARVGVWGGSAGGHLTGLVATTCGGTAVDPSPAPKGSECVQAAVTWYGVFDFAPMLQKAAAVPTPKPAEYALLRCRPEDCTPAQVAAVSPIQHVDRNDPPMLLIHGEKDQVVDVSQSHQMEAALKSAGVAVDAIYIPAVDHSFIGQTPESTRAATLKAVNATFDFFHKTLQVPSK